MPQIRALIVEDDHSLQLMYKTKLEYSGFAVKTANNGQEGLQMAESFIPDIILLDLRMPIMSGETMLQKLRASDWGGGIRVIILTNISRDEAPSMLRFLSVDRYIIKAHSTPTQVVDIVNDVLGIK